MIDIRVGQISFTDLGTSLTARDLRTSLLYQDVSLSATYVSASITNMYLDSNFKVYQFADLFTLTDFLTAVITKSQDLFDSLGTTENVTFNTGKVLDDPVFFADAIVVLYNAFRTFPETIALADLAILNTTRSASDNLTLSDTSAIKSILTNAETVTPSDSSVFSFSLVYADTLAIGDSIFLLNGFNLSLAETLAMSDSILSMPIISFESSIPNVSAIGAFALNI